VNDETSDVSSNVTTLGSLNVKCHFVEVCKPNSSLINSGMLEQAGAAKIREWVEYQVIRYFTWFC